MSWTYPAELKQVIQDSCQRFDTKLTRLSPYLGQVFQTWAHELSPTKDLSDYFTHPSAFATFLFPWWLEEELNGTATKELQADLAYSSICGYYFIRLIDNAMDSRESQEIQLLPILGVFHMEFTSIYQQHFESQHPFWTYFEQQWAYSAEASTHDSGLKHINKEEFCQIASKKVCAGKIPIQAVFSKYQQPFSAQWNHFFELMSQWHQMQNDLFDWQRDLKEKNQTFLLSQAPQQSEPAVLKWLMNGGFEWATSQLNDWMNQAQQIAKTLKSQHPLSYLNYRQATLDKQSATIQDGFRTLQKLQGFLS